MGAGYAAALGGELISALGPADDPASAAIAGTPGPATGSTTIPCAAPTIAADWTLLLTSGDFGDKLPIGFRGCHAALDPEVIASRVASVVRRSGWSRRCRTLWPSRSCDGPERPSGSSPRRCATCATGSVPSRGSPMRSTSSVATAASGRVWTTARRWPGGSRSWRSPTVRAAVASGSPRRPGEPGLVTVPAFERALPPRDTNRAGEAYAATLLTTLLDGGWSPGVAEEELVAHAASAGGGGGRAGARPARLRLSHGGRDRRGAAVPAGSTRHPMARAGAVRYNAHRQEIVPGEEPS